MRTTVLSLAVVAIAGCGTPSRPPLGNAAMPARARATGLPSLYAELFVEGATWSFSGRAERRGRDERQAEVITDVVNGKITCRVAIVMVIRGGVRADLDCSADRPDFTLTNPPGGTLIGTADGLWAVSSDFKNDIATLDPRRVLLPSHPHAGRREIVDRGADLAGDDFVQAIETHEVAGGWCAVYHMDGEWEGWQLCFRAGDGVIGGAGFYLGAGATLFQFGDHWPM